MKRSLLRQFLRRWWWVIILLLLLGGYWVLPISGQVIVLPAQTSLQNLWPQIAISPANAQPGEEITLTVTDTSPWTNVRLLVHGEPIV